MIRTHVYTQAMELMAIVSLPCKPCRGERIIIATATYVIHRIGYIPAPTPGCFDLAIVVKPQT